MTLYDRILVPTDGSPEGRRAVAHAIELAEAHDATVFGLFVIETASYYGLPAEASLAAVTPLLGVDAQAALDDVTDLGAARGVPVETQITEGLPSREIVRVANAQDCDLIVMGTHGRGGIDRLLLGSIAEKVVRAARIPVTTVKVGTKPAERSGTATAETVTHSETPIEADSQTR